MSKQYNLFEATKQAVIEPEYPWQGIFPDWMPQVGGLAQMHAVILEEQGYCYGDCVRINSIEGENVTCTVEHQMDADWWKNGTVYTCTLNDLCPNMYHNNKYNEDLHNFAATRDDIDPKQSTTKRFGLPLLQSETKSSNHH